MNFSIFNVCLALVVVACLQSQIVLGVTGPANLNTLASQTVTNYNLVGDVCFTGTSNGGVCAIGNAGKQRTTSTASINRYSSSWHAGSLTKSATASLAAILIRDPNVNIAWETKLSQVFPNALSTPYKDVTLEQLVSHRGGIQPNPPNWWIYPQSGQPLIKQRQQAVQDALYSAPAGTPGVTYTYSNWGVMIAGAMLENRTGIVWEQLMQQRLFTPLGMQSAYFGCPTPAYSPYGHLYNNGLNPYTPKEWCNCVTNTANCGCDNAPVLGPAGTVYMQAGDYIRYYGWHLAGELGTDTSGLLTQADFQRLHSPVGGTINGYGDKYGHGWIVTSRSWGGGVPVLTHEGSNTLWDAVVWIAPGINQFFFAGTNSYLTKTGGSAYNALDNMIWTMIQANYPATYTCPHISTLDSGRTIGTHPTCNNYLY